MTSVQYYDSPLVRIRMAADEIGLTGLWFEGSKYDADRLPNEYLEQAVGGAVGRNPIAIIIPCHRVVGVDGSLTGYAGGLDRKIKLLELEHTASVL